MKNKLFLFLFLSMFFITCKSVYKLPGIADSREWKTQSISPSPQILTGDPDSGFYYLTQGAYLGTGLPYAMLKKKIEKNPQKFVRKSGLASEYGYAVFKSEYGVEVMNGTCFSCHAGAVDDEVYLGVGNALNDNQANMEFAGKLMNWNVRRKYKRDTATIDSFDEFGKYFSHMAPYIETNNPGVNPAARIAEACMRFRNPIDLTYTSEPQYDVREYNMASDIPALWHLQKKNALYYTGVGRGDFTKLLFQASVLGIRDSTQARIAQEKFVHITAWIRSLEAPKYPRPIDNVLAQQGKDIFLKKCKSCHGTYDNPETYPNKVVALNVIGTDPLYANYATDSKIVDWYNKSWFATSEPKSRINH